MQTNEDDNPNEHIAFQTSETTIERYPKVQSERIRRGMGASAAMGFYISHTAPHGYRKVAVDGYGRRRITLELGPTGIGDDPNHLRPAPPGKPGIGHSGRTQRQRHRRPERRNLEPLEGATHTQQRGLLRDQSLGPAGPRYRGQSSKRLPGNSIPG